jgi:hypothetical protein
LTWTTFSRCYSRSLLLEQAARICRTWKEAPDVALRIRKIGWQRNYTIPVHHAGLLSYAHEYSYHLWPNYGLHQYKLTHNHEHLRFSSPDFPDALTPEGGAMYSPLQAVEM